MNRDEILEIYQRLVAPYDDIKVKGAKSAYTAVNGNMFSFLDPDNVLCFRFSEADKKSFNEQHGGSDVIQYGAVMRGYVAVPAAMLADESALADLFSQCLAHARSLKPKPTKKPK